MKEHYNMRIFTEQEDAFNSPALSHIVRLQATKRTRFAELVDDGKPKPPPKPVRPRTEKQRRATVQRQAWYDKLAEKMRRIVDSDPWVHDHYNERDPYDE